jgi:hypothetical protein
MPTKKQKAKAAKAAKKALKHATKPGQTSLHVDSKVLEFAEEYRKLMDQCTQCKKSKADTESGQLLTCSGCLDSADIILYCSRQCQKLHWVAGHKNWCTKTKKPTPAPQTTAVVPTAEE